MKCQGCGHEYPSTFPRCSRCGELSPKRTLRTSQSRLLEFPRKTRVEVERESSESSLPSWRKELNEKVRAVKARKIAAGPEQQTVEVGSVQRETAQSAQSDPRSRKSETLPRTVRPAAGSVKSDAASGPLAGPRTSNAIVEAALTRVRRASENASRASLARIEPARTAHKSSVPSMVIEREATARALEVAAEINPPPSVEMPPIPTGLLNKMQAKLQTSASRVREPHPLPVETEAQSDNERPAANPQAAPARVREPRTLPVEIEEPSAHESRQAAAVPHEDIEPTEVQSLPEQVEEPGENIFDSIAEDVQVSVRAIDEIEPLDYLQAEIRKIDRAREEEFAHNESPSRSVHAIIAVIDLLTVAVSATPFLAVIEIMDGRLGDGRTQLAAGLIVLLVSFFYLAVTQCLSGKTLGMMMTNTRIVDVHTFESPSGQRLLLRTIGYFVAIAPATLGLLWFVVDRYRRGWQDVISGTRVVRDF